jgi:hypothetical protein
VLFVVLSRDAHPPRVVILERAENKDDDDAVVYGWTAENAAKPTEAEKRQPDEPQDDDDAIVYAWTAPDADASTTE